MPRIYIAGPLFNGDFTDIPKAEQNVERGINIAQQLMQKGWSPYLPHYSLDLHKWQIKYHHPPFSWERWLDLDQDFIEVCQALFFFGHSKGADRELEWALNHDMKVYTGIEQVPNIVKGELLTNEEQRGLVNTSNIS